MADQARDAAVDAKNKETEAKNAEIAAKNEERLQREAADKARKDAVAARDKAVEAEKKEKEQRELAEQARRNAEAARQQEAGPGSRRPPRKRAVAATYRAKVALVASQVEANVFNRAKAELADIVGAARGTPEFQPPPWEFRRLQYMLDLSDQTLDVGFPVYGVAFSPDGQLFAAGGENPEARLWKVGPQKPQPLPALTTEFEQVAALAFVGSGGQLVTASNGAVAGPQGDTLFATDITLWNVESRQNLKTFSLRGKQWVQSLSAIVTPGGLRLVTTSLNRQDQLASKLQAPGDVQVWTGGETPLTLSGHYGAVWGAAVSPDGRTIVSADNVGYVWVWQSADGAAYQLVRDKPFLPHGSQPVYRVRFSPDGKLLATAGGDSRILLWKSDALLARLQADQPPEPERALLGHTAPVRSLGFSADGGRLVSGGDDGTVRVWDVAAGAPVVRLRGHSNAVRSCVFSPASHDIVLSGGLDGEVRLWNVSTYREQLTLAYERAPEILAAAFSPDGRRVVTSHRKDLRYSTAVLWELTTQRGKPALAETEPRVLEEGHTQPATSACLVPGPAGAELLTTGMDGFVRLWDFARGVELHRLGGVSTGRSYGAPLAVTSADGRWLLGRLSGQPKANRAGVWDRQRLRAAADLQPDATLTGHTDHLTAVAASRTGRFLFTGDASGKGLLWKADPQQKKWVIGWTLPPLGLRISAACFLPDESRLLCAASYQVRQFDAAGGREFEAGRLNHPDQQNVISLALTADGTRLLTGCDGGTLTLWDVAQPEAAARLDEVRTERQQLTAVALTPDGRRAARCGPAGRLDR